VAVIAPILLTFAILIGIPAINVWIAKLLRRGISAPFEMEVIIVANVSFPMEQCVGYQQRREVIRREIFAEVASCGMSAIDVTF